MHLLKHCNVQSNVYVGPYLKQQMLQRLKNASSYSPCFGFRVGCSCLISTNCWTAAAILLRADRCAWGCWSWNIPRTWGGVLHLHCLCTLLLGFITRLRGNLQLLNCRRNIPSLLSLLQIAHCSLSVVLRQLLEWLICLRKDLKVIAYHHLRGRQL